MGNWLSLAVSELAFMGLLVSKDIGRYRRALRANARAAWNGTWDFFDFYVAMLDTIQNGFTQAFHEGAASCGIRPEELTNEENLRLQAEIITEQNRVENLADFIAANSKAAGGKWLTVQNRIELWAQAYNRIYALAQTLACGDKKFRWTLHPAEHCRSCLKLSGKVKRGSFWANNVQPKSWEKLVCRLGCRCTLDETDDPLTPGPLPALP